MGALVLVLLAGVGVERVSAQTLLVTWSANPEPNISAYRVSVGVTAGRYTETFDVPGAQTWFVYVPDTAGRRYYFSVAAQANTRWSAQSLEVSEVATDVPARPPESLLPSSPAPDGGYAPPSERGCLDLWSFGSLWCGLRSAASSRLGATTSEALIAAGLGPVGALAVSSSGAGLAVEGDGVVRFFDGNGLSAEPALELDPDIHVEALALAPTFDQTGLVFLAVSRPSSRGTRELTIERHRLVGGRLGEGAAIVPGLSLSDGASTAIAATADRRLLIALPGVVLSFTADGTLPASQASPVLGEGPTQPLVMDFDATSQTLWVAGRDAAGDVSITRLSGEGRQVARLESTVGWVKPGPGAPVLLAAASGVRYVVMRTVSPTGSSADTIVRVSAASASAVPAP